ncbi:MAG TPA: crosslink repair DNA glycosylase YcaQ family protein [Mycobacteriales bacterium]|nr:crosslink repair DNA glycosylase YcaQ family protein [Mycobacteriales bacterium]
MRVSREQAIAYRLQVNHLATRMAPGSYPEAAHVALQDTVPRSALLSLHARVSGCEPAAWEDPRLVQTYSPRAAVHVVPERDLGVFTIGRLPDDPEERRATEDLAERICRVAGPDWMDRRDLPAELQPELRRAVTTGRLVIRWDTRSIRIRQVPPPAIERDDARLELCRRHIHAFGPTNPVALAWWAGISTADARNTWERLAGELIEVTVDEQPAWILAADEPAVRSAEPAAGVRLLPAEELRLFGVDRTRTFVAPSREAVPPFYDTFHPHGLVVGGRVVGSWGRRQGAVDIRVGAQCPARVRSAIEAEALSLPIPRARMSVTFTIGEFL